jgi:hypothetical protein
MSATSRTSKALTDKAAKNGMSDLANPRREAGAKQVARQRPPAAAGATKV